MNWMDIIVDPRFIDLLSTFGLAVVLVLYFVFWRDPRQAKFRRERDEKQNTFWKDRYDNLLQNYELLSKNYIRLEEDLRPESRRCSDEQAIRLAELGLDRDLYKLYYFMCEKLDGRRHEDIGTFMAESIIGTNNAWSQFKSPFPRVERIGDLYGNYTKNGESLKQELEKILEEDIPNEERKPKVWKLLFEDTVNMKGEFHGFIQSLNDGKEVSPYCERAETANDKA